MGHEFMKFVEELERDLGRRLDARKLWQRVRDCGHLSRESLDRLALLAGFQTWRDLQEALRGEGDASLNYDDEPEEDDRDLRPACGCNPLLGAWRGRKEEGLT